MSGRDAFAALVIRTDYSDDTAWQAVRAELLQPWGDGDYEPVVHVVDDPTWAEAAADEVISVVSADEELSVVFLADRATMLSRHHAMLAVAVLTREECASDEEFDVYGGAVRTVPAGVHDIHANLAIANLDFADVLEAARSTPEGVFRSF
ncbi:DUF6924 domain-containing protein [Streptomyces sp. NPDC058457]|uniref:DUF6924 domain-containing protein n=1 Tax=Streptomyces sp. NPDC058457 TaxID=3346507 RepID=UPI0036597715